MSEQLNTDEHPTADQSVEEENTNEETNKI